MWYIAKSIRHHFQTTRCHYLPSAPRCLLRMQGAYFEGGAEEKQNAFSQSSFYFLHQHFETAPQISRNAEIRRAISLPKHGYGKETEEVCVRIHTYTHTYLRTQLAYFKSVGIWVEHVADSDHVFMHTHILTLLEKKKLWRNMSTAIACTRMRYVANSCLRRPPSIPG